MTLIPSAAAAAAMSPLPDFNFTVPIHCSSSDDEYRNFCESIAPPISSDAMNVPIELPQSYKTGSHHVSTLLILTAALLSFAALLFFFLYLLLRRRRRNPNRTRHVVVPLPSLAQDAANPDYDHDDQTLEMHHVWLIRTVGLDEDAIKSIAVFEYRSEEKVADIGDCAVCLTEFRDGEKLRLLPRCCHAFHMACIDTWLRSHVNCPLCRSPVLVPTKNIPVGYGEQGYQGLGQTLIGENGDFDGNTGNLGTESSIQIVVDPSSSDLTLEGDLDHSSNGFQTIRRSVSMDSLPLGAIRREAAENTNNEALKRFSFSDERVAKDRGKQGNSAKDVSFPNMVMGMKRPMSSSGGCWFYPTRQGRGSRSSILPL